MKYKNKINEYMKSIKEKMKKNNINLKNKKVLYTGIGLGVAALATAIITPIAVMGGKQSNKTNLQTLSGQFQISDKDSVLLAEKDKAHELIAQFVPLTSLFADLKESQIGKQKYESTVFDIRKKISSAQSVKDIENILNAHIDKVKNARNEYNDEIIKSNSTDVASSLVKLKTHAKKEIMNISPLISSIGGLISATEEVKYKSAITEAIKVIEKSSKMSDFLNNFKKEEAKVKVARDNFDLATRLENFNYVKNNIEFSKNPSSELLWNHTPTADDINTNIILPNEINQHVEFSNIDENGISKLKYTIVDNVIGKKAVKTINVEGYGTKSLNSVKLRVLTNRFKSNPSKSPEKVIPFGFELPKDMKVIKPGFFEDVILPSDFKLPQGLEEIGDGAFRNTTFNGTLQIPDSVNKIGQLIFENTVIPEGFTLLNTKIDSIPSQAFKGAILPKNFELPKAVKQIGDQAFYGATIPSGFKIPDGITEIPSGMFHHAKITNGLSLPDSITQIGGYAFADAKIWGEFTLENTKVELIEGRTFINAILPSGFNLPNTLKKIDDYAFSGAIVGTGFTLANTSLETLMSGVFQTANLPSSFALPDSLHELEYYVFSKTKFGHNSIVKSEFTLENTAITVISSGTFKETVLPSGFALPDGVTELGNNSFNDAFINLDFALPLSVSQIKTTALKNLNLPEGSEWFNDKGKQDNNVRAGSYVSKVAK